MTRQWLTPAGSRSTLCSGEKGGRRMTSASAPGEDWLAAQHVAAGGGAEDIVQESYLNIWTHIQDYRAAQGAPLTWMSAIVRNRALDWVRRPSLEQGREDYAELVESLPGGGPQPDQALEAGRNASALALCLQRLSANERQVIVLAYLYGLSHSELARHLNQPRGTVKTWVRRGLHKLKTQHRGSEGEGGSRASSS